MHTQARWLLKVLKPSWPTKRHEHLARATQAAATTVGISSVSRPSVKTLPCSTTPLNTSAHASSVPKPSSTNKHTSHRVAGGKISRQTDSHEKRSSHCSNASENTKEKQDKTTTQTQQSSQNCEPLRDTATETFSAQKVV